MIRIPTGFATRLDGDVLILTNGAIELRYVERLRPMATVESLWGEPSRPRPFVTNEGEYAWMLDAPGRALGAVVGDDFLAVLEGTTASEGDQATLCTLVEDLLRRDEHLLGVRRRPFFHEAPDGWTIEVRAPFYTTYRAGDALIEVSPALPCTLIDRAALLASLPVPTERAITRVDAPIRGVRWSAVRDDDRCVEAFVLDDGDYVYVAVGETSIGTLPQLEAALEHVMRTAEPIPRSRSRTLAHAPVGVFRRAINAGL